MRSLRVDIHPLWSPGWVKGRTDMRRRDGWGVGWATQLACCLAGMCGAAWSEEPAAEFLRALRDNQYYDVALMYLDSVASNPRIPAEFRSEMDYQRGWTLVEAAAAERNRAARERMLQQAKDSLERFLAEQQDHPARSAARRQYGFLLREWGRMKLEQGRSTNDATVLQEAAGLFDRAAELFDEAVGELRNTLSTLPKEGDPAAPGPDNREALRIEFLDSLLRAAEVFEDKAETQPSDSTQRKELLSEAARRYADMHEKYPRRLAGLQARVNQARVWKKLGDTDQALVCLTEDVLNQEDESPPVRRLKTRALLLAIDCWLDESRRESRQVIERAEPWLKTMRPAEERDPDWVLLRLQVAKAHRSLAEQLRERDARDPGIRASRDAARNWAREVSRIPGEYQDEARQLLAALPGGAPVPATDQKPPADFATAKTNATNAIAEMRNAESLIETIPARLGEETDASVRGELQATLEGAEQSVIRHRQEAVDNLRLALQLADKQTAEEDLNLVRQLLAFVLYAQGEYYDAAVLGEFLCRRFPAATGSQLSAQVALAAYQKLFDEGSRETIEFATQRLESLAGYVVQTWSGTPEAAEAISALIPFLIRQGDLDGARAYAEQIPEDSPQRGPAELRVGEALWRSYLLGVNEVRQWERDSEQADAAPDQAPDLAAELAARIAARTAELEQQKTTALDILETGVARMKQTESLDPTVPRAVLALAQVYVDSDQAPRAIELLDDEKIGVLPMLERDDPRMQTPELREHAYRVALAAVVSALSKVEGAEPRTALIERSRQLVEAIRQQVGDASESQQRLVEIFFSLARGMETQLRLQSRPEDRRLLSEGFRTFLDQVRTEANDLRMLNWVAESYVSLGNGLADDPDSKALARQVYQNAVATYQQILDAGQSFDLPPPLRRQLTVRLAVAQRGAGQFAAATDLLAKALADDPRTLEYQLEAAMTYQLWGAELNEASRYLEAVRGAHLDPNTNQNVVWGWSRIARVTQRYPQYRETFHQARYNTALCHYKYALRLKQKEQQQKFLTQARNDIEFTQRLYPNMGGETWWAAYHELLKKIQQSLGERAVGLAGGPPR
jgi:tetratricopeptide (TPR) repeat protein